MVAFVEVVERWRYVVAALDIVDEFNVVRHALHLAVPNKTVVKLAWIYLATSSAVL